MRISFFVVAMLGLAACTNDNGKPGLLTNTFCGMRESACKQRCEAMDAQASIACRRSCEDSGRDKCG